MAKLNLQEMYLTEYNRLIVALQKHFTDLKGKTKISEITDWLNARQAMTPITEIDLNKITFTGDEYQYSYGGQTIKLKKDNDLTGSNIVVGKVIEGITGTAVDGSVLEVTQDQVEGLLGKVGSDVGYWYYDTVNRKLSKKQGTATLLNDQILNGLEYNESNEEFGFKNDDENNSNYYKNFKISVPKAVVTAAADGSSWAISKGYLPEPENIQKLTDAEKEALQIHLEYNSKVLGIKGSNKYIINTEVLGADEVNPSQIIVGQKYFRNGEAVSGGLNSLLQSSMTYSSDDKYDTSFVPEISNTHTYTYLRVPGNSYTHNDWYFDISNLKPNNIRDGVKIMGIEGTGAIYDSFPGPYSVQLGEELPNDLETTNYNLNDNISFSIDNTVINPKNIRTGIKILGQTGNFTANDGALSYIEYSSTDSTGIDNNDQPIIYRETDDIKQGCWAFMDGHLCKGTNVSLKISPYAGDYEINLGEELPLPLPTTNKALYNDIKFKVDPSIIKKEVIAYGNRILGVDGEFSYCTTNPVTSDKIVQDYVAYVNGVEVLGSSPEYVNEIPTTIKGEALPTGFYKGVHVKPLYAEINGNVYTASSAEGRDTIAGYLREGVTLYSGRTGDSIIGVGKLIFTANSSEQANDYLEHAVHNEIVLYTGADNGIFKENNYLEIVTQNEIGLVGTAPAFDPLIKARSLSDGSITSNTVLSGQIGYGYRGERVIGAIPVLSAEDQKITIKANDIYWNDNASKVYNKGYYENGPQLIIDKDTISPDSIKHGEKIFGVEGTYSPNVQPKTITWQRTWGNEATFKASEETPNPIDGYNQVTINVNTGTATNTFTENKVYRINADEPSTNLIGWTEVNVQVPIDGVLEHTITPQEVYNTNLVTKVFDKLGINADKEAWKTAKITVPLKNELVITNGTNKITDYNLTYSAEGYTEGINQCLGFKKVKLNLIPKLYDLIGTNAITSNGIINIADYPSYDGFGNIEVYVAPVLHTKTITWDEIVSQKPIDASTLGITGWNTINFSYTEDNIKQNAEKFLTPLTLGVYHIGNTITPSDGAIGFNSVTLDIKTSDLTITKDKITDGSMIMPPFNNLYDRVNFDVTATNHEITVEEIRKGVTINAPEKQLFKQISFASDVTNLINPVDTTATSKDIVFGATAVLDGVLTTGTMGPILYTKDDGTTLIQYYSKVDSTLTVTPSNETFTSDTNKLNAFTVDYLHRTNFYPAPNVTSDNLNNITPVNLTLQSATISSTTNTSLPIAGFANRELKPTLDGSLLRSGEYSSNIPISFMKNGVKYAPLKIIVSSDKKTISIERPDGMGSVEQFSIYVNGTLQSGWSFAWSASYPSKKLDDDGVMLLNGLTYNIGTITITYTKPNIEIAPWTRSVTLNNVLQPFYVKYLDTYYKISPTETKTTYLEIADINNKVIGQYIRTQGDNTVTFSISSYNNIDVTREFQLRW